MLAETNSYKCSPYLAPEGAPDEIYEGGGRLMAKKQFIL